MEVLQVPSKSLASAVPVMQLASSVQASAHTMFTQRLELVQLLLSVQDWTYEQTPEVQVPVVLASPDAKVPLVVQLTVVESATQARHSRAGVALASAVFTQRLDCMQSPLVVQVAE